MSEETLKDLGEKARRQHSFYLEEELYKLFAETAKRANRKSVSQALEEAMVEWIMKHQEEANMQVIRRIPEQKAIPADSGTRVAIVMMKRKLEPTIVKLEKMAAGENGGDRKFLEESLLKNLKKAIPLQRRTQDRELEQLFSRAEKLLLEERERHRDS